MAFQKNIGEHGRKAAMPGGRGQVSVELVIITSVMVGLLLVMLLVNNSLQTSWNSERQILEATSAASQVALAINRAAAGGDGTTISFINTVSPDVTRMEVFDRRTVRAYYKIGGYASSALVTNSTNISGNISLNTQLIIANTNGTITLTNGPEPGPLGTSCGGSGEACCASDTCDGGNICSAATCVACGAYGQPCCESLACNPLLTCSSGTCQCGGSGQPCCSGTTCSATYACNLTSVLCQSCGAASGQLCCAGDNCTSPLACNTTATPQHVCYLNVSEVTCGILSTPNTVYTLNRSVSINGSTCFNITAANVTLNCNGYSAAGNNTGSTFGVYSNQANTTVQNCVISGFDAGVYYNGVTTGVVRNTNATSTGPTYGTGLRLTSGSGNVISGSSGTGTFNGILIDSSSNNNVSNSTGNSSTSRGIYIYSSSNNTISDSTAASNSNYALALYSSSGNTFSKNKLLSGAGASILLYIYSTSSGNTFYWNNFTPTSGFYVSDSNGSNFYNTTISGHGEGNIWANVMNGSVAITGTNNSTGFPSLYYGTAGSGYPYNNTTAGGKLSGAVVDYAPLTSATTLTCGLLSTPNTVYTLTSSQSINGATCFNVTAANVTLDCNRYSVTGNNAASTYGVYSSQNFTTIKNCNISGFYAGIYFVGASNGTIRDTNSSSSTGLGIYLNSNSNYTLITGASASSSALYGFYAYAGGFTRINNSNMTSSANSALRLHTCPNATITGSTMSSPQTSLDLEPGSHGASVSNSQILGGASYALLLYAVQNSTFANNTINGRGATYAASVQATSTGNLFVNNTFLNASGMVSLASTCGANRFYWNNFTSASGYYVADANGSNFYNTTISGHGEGNIWANVMNGSVSITGTANSSISGLYVGSSGSGYPYNNTTAGGKLSGPVVDYAPLTPNFCGTWLARTSAGVRSWYGIASSSDGTNLAAVVSSGYIYTSTDSGASWAERTNAGSRSWWSIASSSDGTKLAASVIPGYIYTSTDSGASWTERTGAGSRYWYSIASSLDGTKLAAAVYGGYIYTSTDSGASWTQQTGSGNRSWYGIASSSDGTKLAASVSNGYIYTSTDSGVTWTQRTGSGSRYWYSIASSSDGTMLAATDNNNGIGGYIYTSTDSGASWTARTVAGSRKWQSIASSSNGTMLVANADYDDYIYVSNDSGASWTAQTGMGTSNTARVATSSNGAKIAVARYSGTKYIYTYMSCQ